MSQSDEFQTATALVLAGKRDGRLDPLAADAGVPLKCLVPVAGAPLIAHVIRALEGCEGIGEIRIAAGEERAIEQALTDAGIGGAGRRTYVAPQFHIVDSVIAAAEGVEGPILITTADNVLLTPATVAEFVAGAVQVGEGCAVAMARKEAVLAVHPTGQRRFYRFTDGEFSNCNMYWLGSRKALRAAEVFRTGGQFIKFPARIAKAFGIVNLIRFKLGIGSTKGFFASVGRRFGFPVKMVELSDGAAAIDVDHARSHAVAEQVLEQRRA